MCLLARRVCYASIRLLQSAFINRSCVFRLGNAVSLLYQILSRNTCRLERNDCWTPSLWVEQSRLSISVLLVSIFNCSIYMRFNDSTRCAASRYILLCWYSWREITEVEVYWEYCLLSNRDYLTSSTSHCVVTKVNSTVGETEIMYSAIGSLDNSPQHVLSKHT